MSIHIDPTTGKAIHKPAPLNVLLNAEEMRDVLEAIRNDAEDWLEGDNEMPAEDLFCAIKHAADAVLSKTVDPV